ncbi:MAG: hypothetical protein OHK0029_02630 [Armatimonadaceae bacterium]
MAEQETGAKERTDLDLEYFRKRLMQEREDAEAIINVNKELVSGGRMAITDPDRNDLQTSEAGYDLQRRAQDAALIENAERIVERVDHALERMRQGTYGYSEHSGKPIPVERLEAVPYAALTVEEQERFGS